MNNGPFGFSRRQRPSHPHADVIAIQALTFIGSDPDQAGRFLSLTGLAPGDLRRSAADPAFLVGVMDYIVGDEPLLLRFAAHAGLAPEAIVQAHELLTR